MCLSIAYADDSLLPLTVCVRALDVTVSQSSIQVARGQAAVLPCSFTTSAALNNLNIIWMVTPLSNANQPEQVQSTPATHSFINMDRAFLWPKSSAHLKKCETCIFMTIQPWRQGVAAQYDYYQLQILFYKKYIGVCQYKMDTGTFTVLLRCI